MDTSLSINNQSMIKNNGGEVKAGPTLPKLNKQPANAVVEAPELESIDAEALQARMEKMAERLQEFVRENGRQLEFQVNNDSGEVVILVRHAASGEVLRSIPPEEARQLAEQAVVQDQARLLSLEV